MASRQVSLIVLLSLVLVHEGAHFMPKPALAFYIGRGWLGCLLLLYLWRGWRITLPVFLVGLLYESATSICGSLFVVTEAAQTIGLCDDGARAPLTLLSLAAALAAALYEISTGEKDG